MACLNACDVVILAGGQGSRLRPVFPSSPKAMLPVNDEPFVRYLIEQVNSFGARRVILALGHLAELVQTYVASQAWGALNIVTAVEPTPLGTGGALRAVLPLLESEVALVMNGDSFIRVDLCRFLEFHHARAAALSMVLTSVPNVDRYGVVETNEEGLVTSFLEKQTGRSGGSINAGLYLINQAVIRTIPPDHPVSLEEDVFPSFCHRGFYALKGDFPFLDIGTPESCHLARAFFRDQERVHDH